MKSILIVDDDQLLLNLLHEFFTINGFSAQTANNGSTALSCFYKSSPDLLLIDLEMPQMNGFEIVEKIREHDYITPIILMTGSWLSESHKIKGYEMGAIQFLEKPLELPVLLAQIKALLYPPVIERKLTGCGREIILKGQIVSVGDLKIPLREREAQILTILFENPGKTITRKKLQTLIWCGYDQRNDKTLNTLLYQLKKKLEAFPELAIKSNYSKGYLLEITPSCH